MSEEIRQFPTEKDFLQDKTKNGLVYGFYQTNSYLTDGKVRYCWKKEVSQDKMIEFLGKEPIYDKDHMVVGEKSKISKSTITRVNKILKDAGYLVESKMEGKSVWILPDRKPGTYVFINLKTLGFLISTTNQYVLKIYAYLKLKQYQHDTGGYKEDYKFTKENLMEVIGINRGSKDSYFIIDSILNSLKNNGLIEWESIIENIGDGTDRTTNRIALKMVNEDYTDNLRSRIGAEMKQLEVPVCAEEGIGFSF